MSTQILSNLLEQRFRSRSYWPELMTQLNGWPPHCGSQAVEVVGDGQLEKLPMVRSWRFSLRPFLAACKEVEALRKMCESLTDTNVVRRRIIQKVGLELEPILERGSLVWDLAMFSRRFLAVSAPEQVVRDARWVKDSNTQTATLAIGPELQWLLMVSRCLGLIEFKTLEKLRHTRVRVLGASVAAGTIELLASLGCEDIVCVDDGLIDPSNQPRLPMAKLSNWGCPKSAMLVHHLLRRYPYGKFRAVVGKVVPSLLDRQGAGDVTIDEFLRDADVIIEVVDDLKMKVLAQTVALAKKPDVPLIFIADVGVSPVVRTVKSDASGKITRPFGRDWSDAERDILEKVIELPANHVQGRQRLQQSAYLMVKEVLPPEHALQFLVSCLGEMSFWSQTPIASRLSAGQAALEVLRNLGHVSDPLVTENATTITNVCQQFLGLNIS